MGDDTTESGLPRAVAAAWGLLETPQRGPTRGLSHPQIAEAAVRIADREGLAAVTMASVAQSLGFTTMSLYRYVASKEELLRLMQNAAVEVPEYPDLPRTWPEGIIAWADLVRRTYIAHPWLLDLPRDQTSVLMPNTVRAAELGLDTMTGLDLEDSEKIGIILLISQHVMSTLSLSLSLAAEGGLSISAQGFEQLASAMSSGEFPHLLTMMSPAGPPTEGGPADPDLAAPAPDPADVSEEYELGLTLITAGVEALLARRHQAANGSAGTGQSG